MEASRIYKPKHFHSLPTEQTVNKHQQALVRVDLLPNTTQMFSKKPDFKRKPDEEHRFTDCSHPSKQSDEEHSFSVICYTLTHK